MNRWFASIVCILIIAFLSGYVFSDETLYSDGRNDVIEIDSSPKFVKNERPPVYFFHDLHTDAISHKSGNCETCHTRNDGKLSFLFVGSDKQTWDSSMNEYHDRCIGCHTESMAAREPAGPVVCSGCHQENYKIENAGEAGSLDKSLHQRHVKALDKRCESCHHIYDPVNKKTFYKKGEEGSCTYCHPGKENGKDMTLRVASHNQCIVCHTSTKNAGKKTGPARCEGCHDASIRESYKKADTIERLQMGQKDTMILDPYEKEIMEPRENRMDYVPFDHKNHEKVNESCSVCHHKALESCTHCHTLKGSEKGGFVNLETAMHGSAQERSCTGCHNLKKKSAECSGCHGFDINRSENNEACASCHMVKIPEENPARQAEALINKGIAKKMPVKDDVIPETIVLKKLEKSYEPVTFPHRKIVRTLMENIGDKRLARYFHQENTTVCSGCHHKTPASQTPTACSSCHSVTTTASQDTFRPNLLGAYHIQCMECHVRMDIRQPESCTQCHKEKS